jgi:hypothetical protein
VFAIKDLLLYSVIENLFSAKLKIIDEINFQYREVK